MSGLTQQQDKLLRFIAASIGANGYSPSVSEMAEHLGVSSRGCVHGIVDRLVERGMITRLPGVPRSITVISRVPSAADIARLSLQELADLETIIGAEKRARMTKAALAVVR